MSKTVEQILEDYKDSAFSFSLPIMGELFQMTREYPNDADLGKRVRNLLMTADSYLKEKARKKAEDDLQTILELSKTDERNT
jgi:hypothetical protein